MSGLPKICARVEQTRTPGPFIRAIRDWFLGVKRVQEPARDFVVPNRFPETQASRDQELPQIPGGVHHLLSENYYEARDARRTVMPPDTVEEVIQSGDDILRAIGKIKVLGSGFQVVNVGPGKYLIQSVPSELNIDHTQALELAHETSYLTVAKLCSRLNWDSDRAERVLEHLQSEGLAWVDLQAEDGEAWFWFPGLFVNIP